jgi:hypothetical protein
LSPQLLARLLGLARIGIGVGVWAAPEAAARALGFDSRNPPAMVLARATGTRDIALGAVAAATATDPERAPSVALLCAGVDAGDAVAFGGAVVRREGIDPAALVGTVSALAATAFGVWLASRLR